MVEKPPVRISDQAVDEGRGRASYDADLLKRLLEEEEGMIARVARRLKLSRRQVGRVLRQRGIDPKLFRKGSSQESEDSLDEESPSGENPKDRTDGS
jgi:DNA-binding NtrC family response regulator